jgi:hypothetical protein
MKSLNLGFYIYEITKQLIVTHIVSEGICRSTVRKETFLMLLLSEEDAKHEITEMKQLMERGPEYQV